MAWIDGNFNRHSGVSSRRPSRRLTILALLGQLLIIVKIEDHDVRAPIFGMGREVAISRRVRILFKTTTNSHDLERTVLLAPLLDQVNCVGKSVVEGALPIVGCPSLATAKPVAVERRQDLRPKIGADFRSGWCQLLGSAHTPSVGVGT